MSGLFSNGSPSRGNQASQPSDAAGGLTPVMIAVGVACGGFAIQTRAALPVSMIASAPDPFAAHRTDGRDGTAMVRTGPSGRWRGARVKHGNRAVARRTEIVFVDSRVPDPSALAHALRPGRKLVFLSPDSDGLRQIANTLRKYSHVDAIHIVSHGDRGELLLGNDTLSLATLATHRDALSTIRRALAGGGDLMLYGCDVAAGVQGSAFVSALSQATGANVAASTNPTGATALGGDWDLEIATGHIDSTVPFRTKELEDWDYVLYNATVTTEAQLSSALSTAALDSANDVITISGTISLTGTVDLSGWNSGTSGNLTLQGDGGGNDILDGGYGGFRVLDIGANANVTLDSLIIQKGLLAGLGGNISDYSAPNGIGGNGGDSLGAGIRNAGTLTIVSSTVAHNFASGGGGGAGYKGNFSFYAAGGGGGAGTTGGRGAAGGQWPNYGYLSSSSSAYGSGSGSIGGNGASEEGGTSSAYTGQGGGTTGGAGYDGSYRHIGYGGAGGTAYNASSVAQIGGGGGGGSSYGGDSTARVGGRGGNAVGGIYNTGTLTILTSTIANNFGAGGGGAAVVGSNATLGDGGFGVGGIYNNGGTLRWDTSTNGNFSNNGGGGGHKGVAGSALSSPPAASDGASATNYFNDGNGDGSADTVNLNTSYSPYDSDGDVTAGAGVTEPVPIPTTATSTGSAVDIYDFTISDGGGGDGAAMTVSQIKVHVGGTVDPTKLTYRLNGPDASNVTGTYSSGVITFSGLSISIADGGLETYTVNAYYNNNTGLTENQTLTLSTDGDTDFTVGSSGTQMGTTSAVTNGSGSTVDVTATRLVFSTEPAGSVSGSPLTTQPVVKAEDAAGNTDVDFTGNVALAEASAGTLSGTTTVAASSGVATFTNVTYNATTDGESFTLTAASSGLSDGTANPVTSDIVLGFGSAFSPSTIGPGSTTVLTYTFDNSANTIGATGITFSNTLPAGMTIANPSGATTTCTNGSLSAPAGGNAISFSNYQLAAGGTCTLSLYVTDSTAGAHTNTTGALSSSMGSSGTASASLTVDTARPGFSMVFSPNTISVGGVSTATYTVDNAANGANALLLTINDTFPSGVVLASSPNASSTCNQTFTPTFTATPGSSSMQMQLGGVAAGATCTIQVDVTATAAGQYTHLSSQLSQNGSNPSGHALAQLTVNTPPTVTDGNISISGGSGTGGAYKIGDVVTATWDNTGSGDNNSGITGVTMDFSQFGGGSAVTASNSSGTWTATYTITSGAIDATNRNVSVSATNAGGTTTTADTTNATVDNVAPTVTDANISISGDSGIGGAYKIGDTITATWNDTGSGDNNSDTISGVNVDFSAFGGGSAVTASNSSGTWTATYTITAGTVDGTNKNVTVAATDDAGNSTTATDSTNATVDDVAPTVTDAHISISGATGTGGTFKAGDTVTATWDNTTSGDNNSDTISGVTVDFSAFGGGSVAASNSGGTWTATYTLTPGAISGTNKNVSVTATDDAGNSTTATDTTNATVDTSVPNAPSTPNLAASSDTGSSSTDNITSDTTPTFTGTADANTTVTVISDKDGTLGTTTADGSGNWSFTPGSPLTAATHQLTATAMDPAGNVSTASGALSVTIDTSAPVLTGSTPSNGDTGVAVNANLSLSFDGSVVAGTSGSTAIGVYQKRNDALYESVNAASSAVTISGKTVTVDLPTDFKPNQGYYVQIGSNAFQDTAGNGYGGIAGKTTLAFTVSGTPPTVGNDTATTDEDNRVDIAVLDNDSDPDGIDAASVTVAAKPGHGSASVNTGTGVITYTPTPDYNGTDTFTYTVEDVYGSVSSAGTVTVTVNPVNDPPDAADDLAATTQGTPVTVDVAANDTDRDTGDSVNTGSLALVAPPAHGNAKVQSGKIVYTPASGFTGSDRLAYTVKDSHGAVSSPATVIVNVTGAGQQAPVAHDDTATTAEDTTATIDATANDTDPDGTVDVPTVFVIDGPAHGTTTVDSKTGKISYQPAKDFNGTDSFQYVVQDNSGLSSNAGKVTITVTPVNDPPVAANDTAVVTKNTPYDINVLGNDSDVDGSLVPSSVQVVSAPSAGTATVDSGTGAISYDPGSGFGASTSFTYRVQDNSGAWSVPATVTITSRAVDNPPLANDDTATTKEDTAATIDVLGNDSDVDGILNAASVSVGTAPKHGTATLGSSGAVTYTPDANYNGTDRFTYTVQDNAGESSRVASVAIRIEPVDDAPTVSGSPAPLATAGAAYSFTPTLADVEGDTITVTAIHLPAWATLDPSTGAISGTPTSADVGTYSGIVLTASDGLASSALGPFTITVGTVADHDNDGMPDSYELAHGLNPYDPSDAAKDADHDGVSNLQEYLNGTNPQVDDYPPTIATPSATAINATGLLTSLTTLTPPSATDAHDGPVKAYIASAQTYFVPGVHVIVWAAKDAAGNKATVTQQVDIRPLVSLGRDQVLGEGSTSQVRFLLNGQSPTYPLTVAYTVGGTANSRDSDLTDGTVTFQSGELEKDVTVHIAKDGGEAEGDETLTVTLSGSGNFGAKKIQTITIVDRNKAPRVNLSLSQGGREARLITADGGPVTITANVSDPNPQDSHSDEWQFPSGAIATPVGVDSYRLDPSGLVPGVYQITLTVRDDGSPSLSTTDQESFRVLAAAPTLSSAKDTDGDGVDDAAEGYGDSDQDGEPNYLDAFSLANVIDEQSGDGGHFPIETDPGIRMMLGKLALLAGADGGRVSGQDMAGAGIPADYVSNVGGYFDIDMRGMSEYGASVNVVIPQRRPVPQNAVYRKYKNGVWYDFVTDLHDAIASAPGAEGVCPPPGSSAYRDGLHQGDWCVRLTLQDGGPNDADAAANGVVVDPGGVGTLTGGNNGSGGGGAVGWYSLLTLALLAALAGFRRRMPRTGRWVRR